MDRIAEFYFCSVYKNHPAGKTLSIATHHKSLFDTVASIIDLPDDGRLFTETQPIVRILIKAWQAETGEPFQWNELAELYRSVSVGSALATTWGSRESNPVFSFLMHPLSSSGQIELSAKYTALVPFFIRRVRQCHAQVEDSSDFYLYLLSLAARKLVVGASGLQQSSIFNWNYDFKLSLAISALKKKADESVDLTSAAEWAYISDLLFRDRKKLGKGGGGGHGGERQSRWLLYEKGRGSALQQDFEEFNDFQDVEPDQDCFSPDGKGAAKKVVYIHPDVDHKALLASGEYEADYIHDQELTLPASWFTNPWHVKRKLRGKQEAMLASERVFPWDIRCLSIRKILAILNQLHVRYVDRGQGIIALSLLLGNGEQGLKQLKIGTIKEDEEPSQEVTEKLMQGHRYYDPQNRQLWWVNLRGHEDSENYLNVPLIVHLRLPKIITRHLPSEGGQGVPVFRAKDFRSAKAHLKQLGADGISVPSLKRLQITFEAYFVHGSGMPEILADHIQGRRRNYLTSQHFYISIPWDSTVREWRRMVGVLLRSPEADPSNLIRKMAFRFTSAVADSSSFIGAVKTPLVAALKRHSTLLLSHFPEEQEGMLYASAAQWNAYVSYLYFLLATCTGRRPQRDPFPLFSDFDLDSGLLFIIDKWNAQFKESRVVPLCLTLHQSMINHMKIHNRQLMRWKLSGFTSEVLVNQMFLIDECAKELVEVTPSNLDRLSGIADEPDYFEGLGNGCRHFLLTRLHQVGIPQESIDFVSGHRHVGREPELSASLLSFENRAAMLGDVIERDVVQTLELRVPFSNG